MARHNSTASDQEQFGQMMDDQLDGIPPDIPFVTTIVSGADDLRSNLGSSEAQNDADDPQDGPPSPSAPGAVQPVESPAITVAIATGQMKETHIGSAQVSTSTNAVEKSSVVHVMTPERDLTVVIIGGGPAGFSALKTLIESPPSLRAKIQIILVDDSPTELLGRGVPFRPAPGIAYKYLFMNMFSYSISLEKKTKIIHGRLAELRGGEVISFPLRSEVGEVLGRLASETILKAAECGVQVDILQGRVVDAWQGANGTMMIDTKRVDGQHVVVRANAVLMTVGNEGSSRYEQLKGPGFIDSPWSENSGIHLVPPTATVAIAGTSLTAMDVASVFEAQGHKGLIHMFSPSARLPGIRPLHESTSLKTISPERLSETLSNEQFPLSIEAVIRIVDRELQAHGLIPAPIKQRLKNYLTLSPHDFLIREIKHVGRVSATFGVQKALDDCIAPLWQLMSEEARNYLLKNLSTFAAIQWSAAPTTGLRVLSMLNEKRLIVHRASTTKRASDGRFIVTRKDGTEFTTDVLIDASGFAGGLSEFRDPLIKALNSRQLLTPDATGLGVKVAFNDGRLLNCNGEPAAPIWIGACALTRGTFLLSNELGEATHSATRSATSVLKYFASLLSQKCAVEDSI